jgi:hypothetical protein
MLIRITAVVYSLSLLVVNEIKSLVKTHVNKYVDKSYLKLVVAIVDRFKSLAEVYHKTKIADSNITMNNMS